MSARRPVPATAKTSPRTGRPHCADNDCALTQAEAIKAQAQAVEEGVAILRELLIEWREAKPHLETFAEIGGKWLQFCLWMRKWFPRLWVPAILLLPAVTNISGETADLLFRAVAQALTAYAAGGGG